MVLSFLFTDPKNIQTTILITNVSHFLTNSKVILVKNILNWYGNRFGIVSQGPQGRFEELLKQNTNVSARIRKEIAYYNSSLPNFLKEPLTNNNP